MCADGRSLVSCCANTNSRLPFPFKSKKTTSGTSWALRNSTAFDEAHSRISFTSPVCCTIGRSVEPAAGSDAAIATVRLGTAPVSGMRLSADISGSRAEVSTSKEEGRSCSLNMNQVWTTLVEAKIARQYQAVGLRYRLPRRTSSSLVSGHTNTLVKPVVLIICRCYDNEPSVSGRVRRSELPV